MSKQPIVEFHEVALQYRRRRKVGGSDKHKVLHDVTFDIYRGETLGVIGRNGAGKSTLLKLIAHIIEPDAGRIVRRSERISLLAYQLGFTPGLSGRDNAVQTAMLQGMSKAEAHARMGEVIEFSGLESMIDEPTSSYSAGMRARLGFSVSLLLEPDILLIDEALGVGDAEFKRRSTTAMKERIRSDKTVVLVSHSPDTTLELCDRALWLENGRVVDAGDPEKVLNDYQAYDKLVRRLARERGETLPQVRRTLAQKGMDPLDLVKDVVSRKRG